MFLNFSKVHCLKQQCFINLFYELLGYNRKLSCRTRFHKQSRKIRSDKKNNTQFSEYCFYVKGKV